MMRTFSFSLILGSCLLGCSAAHSDDVASRADDALSSDSTSGFAECPGFGWTTSILSWDRVTGTYARASLASPGDYSSLSIFSDPAAWNQGAPEYMRVVDGMPDSGKISLGTDNPAIGPAIAFLTDDLKSIKELDWALAQQRTRSGKIVGMCLAKASGADGKPAKDPTVFMLSRVGF